MSKLNPRCWKCQTPYHFQTHRPWAVKNLLFFLPLQSYFCPRCMKNRYVWAKKGTGITYNTLSEDDYKIAAERTTAARTSQEQTAGTAQPKRKQTADAERAA